MIILIFSILVLGFIVFLAVNSIYKGSVAYRNTHVVINKFNDLIPNNLQLVNFGSTYAMYAFNCYDDLKLNAFNFALDAQSLEMDDKLLRKYSSKIAPGATVIFGLAACVTYYRYSMVSDKSRYYEFLTKSDIPDYSIVKALRCRFPLSLRRLKSFIAAIVKGQDVKTIYSDYPSQVTQEKMVANMRGMADGWINLFHLKDLQQEDTGVTNLENKTFNTSLLRTMFEYCLNKGWNPVVVIPPFSDILNQYFGEDFIASSLNDMISQARRNLNVEVLDYRMHPAFQQDYGLFLDGGFRLNKRGSEKFVKLVLRDLNTKGYNLTNSSIGC